jgi:hypothetical protein
LAGWRPCGKLIVPKKRLRKLIAGRVNWVSFEPVGLPSNRILSQKQGSVRIAVHTNGMLSRESKSVLCEGFEYRIKPELAVASISF